MNQKVMPAGRQGFIKTLIVVVAGVVIIAAVGYFQQWFTTPEPKKVAIIVPTIPVTELQRSGFLDKMAELGYTEGRNITYLKKEFLPPQVEQLRSAFREAIEGGYDVIYTMASAPALLAYDETQKAAKPVPIVFGVGDMGIVESGAVVDLSSPGKNITGVMSDMPQTVGRSLEFLREISPEAQRVGALTDGFVVPVGIGKFFLQGLRESAARLGFTLVEFKTTIPPGPALEAEAKKILDGIQPGQVDAWVHPPGHFVQPQQFFEAAMAKRIKVPHLVPVPDEVAPQTGGFMAYGENDYKVGGQIAVIVDKILKGASPASIPVEFPREFDLAFNLQTAREIGVTIPDSLLSIADIIFE